MKHQKLYVNHSSFGKVEYFSEGLPSPLSSNYLECGKSYSRKQYPQVVCDLFPYDITKHVKDNFGVMNQNEQQPFHCSSNYGDAGGGYTPYKAFKPVQSSYISHMCWIAPYTDTYNLLEIDAQTTYVLDSWQIFIYNRSGYPKNSSDIKITIKAFFPDLNEWLIMDSQDNVVSGKVYKLFTGITHQCRGFNKIQLYFDRLANDHGWVDYIHYNTISYQDLQNCLVEQFKVPPVQEILGYKAYVNIDYRGILSRYL